MNKYNLMSRENRLLEKKKREELYEDKIEISTTHKDPSNFVKNAIDEILHHIMMARMTEEKYDELVDKLGNTLVEKYKVSPSDLNWTTIEDYIYEDQNSLTYFLDTNEISKILNTLNLKDYDEPESKNFTDEIMEKINNKSLEDFVLYLQDHNEIPEDFLEKKVD